MYRLKLIVPLVVLKQRLGICRTRLCPITASRWKQNCHPQTKTTSDYKYLFSKETVLRQVRKWRPIILFTVRRWALNTHGTDVNINEIFRQILKDYITLKKDVLVEDYIICSKNSWIIMNFCRQHFSFWFKRKEISFRRIISWFHASLMYTVFVISN